MSEAAENEREPLQERIRFVFERVELDLADDESEPVEDEALVREESDDEDGDIDDSGDNCDDDPNYAFNIICFIMKI